MKYRKKPTYIEAFVLSNDDKKYPDWFIEEVPEKIRAERHMRRRRACFK